MKILLVVILGALVAVAKKKDQIPGSKAILAGLVMLGMLASATQWRPDEEAYDESEDLTIGRILGEQMARKVEPGSKVLIFDVGFEPGKSPRVDAHFDGLTEGWGDVQFTPVRIDPKSLVEGEPEMMREAVYAIYEGYMDTGPLLKILQQHPDAAAMVSFVGLPYNVSPKVLKAFPSIYLGKRGVLQVASESLIRMDNIEAIVQFRSLESPEPLTEAEAIYPKEFTRRYRVLLSED